MCSVRPAAPHLGECECERRPNQGADSASRARRWPRAHAWPDAAKFGVYRQFGPRQNGPRSHERQRLDGRDRRRGPVRCAARSRLAAVMFTAAAADSYVLSSRSRCTSCSSRLRPPPPSAASSTSRRRSSSPSSRRARPRSPQRHSGKLWWPGGLRATVLLSSGPAVPVQVAGHVHWSAPALPAEPFQASRQPPVL